MPLWGVKPRASPDVRPAEMVTVAPVKLALSTSARLIVVSMGAAAPFSR